jgi:predicted amidohydrolase YtcJ
MKQSIRLRAALTGAALVGAALASSPARSQSEPTRADRIWTGGTVLTMNDQAMRAQAVAERAGRIVAVGTREQVLKLRGPGTQVIDLAGRTLLPGFVDAHGHVVIGGLQALSANLLAPPDGAVKDIASLQQTVRDWMAANAAAVKKIDMAVGFGYDSASLAELRHPTREELDAISREVPIMLVRQSGHMGVLNSKALQLAGITADTPDPEGGKIHRQAGSKEPAGLIEETAFFPVAVKMLTRIGPEGMQEFVRAGTALWARFGYTTAQEGRATAASVAILRQVAAEGKLPVDVAVYPDVLVDRDFIKANVSRSYVNRVRVAGAKLTIDGSAPAFTAWRDRPYYAPVGELPKDFAGYPAITPQQALDAFDWAFSNDIQLLTHANAEAASDLLIAASTLATLKHGAGKDRRQVLIHGQFLREDQVESFKRLGILPSLFPMHTFYWGDWHTSKTMGPVLGQNISPTGWVRSRGMMFTSHHDAPVAFPDSMRVLDATVTRVARGSGKVIGPQHRVDVITGLKAMTLWPAWQHFEERDKGSIEVGKLADFVILSRDPTQGDPNTIDRIQIAETIKEGVSIYRRPAAEPRKTASTAQEGSGFARFLSAAAAHSDPQLAPACLRQFPGIASALAGAPHDPGCVSRFMVELVKAMSQAPASLAPVSDAQTLPSQGASRPAT